MNTRLESTSLPPRHPPCRSASGATRAPLTAGGSTPRGCLGRDTAWRPSARRPAGPPARRAGGSV
eukprot:2493208-Pyramimonas_sp.AAC.1